MAIASLLKVAFLINLIIFRPLFVFVSPDSKIPKDNNQVLDHKHHNNSTPFPPNFLFGTSSSAYQFEGAYLSDGKGLNNWDVYTHKPGKISDGSNGDVAVDQYHLYLEDTDLMSNLGVNSYRFSISWARILPKGRFGDINKAGIHYYNKLIDALLRKGIQPFVTLSHDDLPQELEEQYGGWLSPKSQKDFRYYADICFDHFGDRVKFWTTLNEPNLLALYSYRTGEFPPGRCSSPFGNCTQGDAEKEPFIAAHNMILAHASAVDVYRAKYQKKQGGRIGIVLHCLWFEPLNNSTADKLAAERAQDFIMNWFLDPIIFGKYPAEMKKILGSNLPEFSSNDMKKLKKGLDFIGINHYTSFYMEDCIYSLCKSGQGITWTEGFARWSQRKDGVPLGKVSEVGWLQIYPLGMEKIVTYLKERYHNTPMIITENGCAQRSKPNNSIEDFVNDKERVEYMSGYLDALMRAMKKGADVRGYFAWSLLDNFEWNDGYTVRFGLHHVDFTTLKRIPRLSATWYKNFITKYSKVVPDMR